MRLVPALVAAALVAATEGRCASWTWHLAAERYRRLNAFERAQCDKAAKLLKSKNPEAAANEYEKFKVQFPDSSALSVQFFVLGGIDQAQIVLGKLLKRVRHTVLVIQNVHPNPHTNHILVEREFFPR